MRAELYSQGADTRSQTAVQKVLPRCSNLAYNNDFAVISHKLAAPIRPQNAGGSMKFRLAKFAVLLLTISCALSLWAGDAIPKIAWKRGIGDPLANPGTRKPQLNDLIDDGYWQGAPVGGFGSGTFSGTYRGAFSRWHLKAGLHK